MNNRLYYQDHDIKSKFEKLFTAHYNNEDYDL